MLATFDGQPGAARAIRCAAAIRQAVRTLGLEIRAGLHAGECELVGDAVGGIAVRSREHLKSSLIGGYTPARRNFDAILVGYYEGRELKHVAKVRGGFTPALREFVCKQFRGIENQTLPAQEFARLTAWSWSVGRRIDGRGDGKIPLAETTARRGDRVPGMEPPRIASATQGFRG
jgi:hypothetical protein